MTTGNDLNRNMTFSEIANEVEQNGYSNLSDEEINYYIEIKIEMAVSAAKAEINLEQQSEIQDETLQILKEQAANTQTLLELKIAEINAKIGDNNE